MRYIFALFIIISITSISDSYAQNCDFLNKIAERSINERLTPEEFKQLSFCADFKKKVDTLSAKKVFVNFIFNERDFAEQIVFLLRFRILKGTTHADIYQQIEDFDVL